MGTNVGKRIQTATEPHRLRGMILSSFKMVDFTGMLPVQKPVGVKVLNVNQLPRIHWPLQASTGISTFTGMQPTQAYTIDKMSCEPT